MLFHPFRLSTRRVKQVAPALHCGGPRPALTDTLLCIWYIGSDNHAGCIQWMTFLRLSGDKINRKHRQVFEIQTLLYAAHKFHFGLIYDSTNNECHCFGEIFKSYFINPDQKHVT